MPAEITPGGRQKFGASFPIEVGNRLFYVRGLSVPLCCFLNLITPVKPHSASCAKLNAKSAQSCIIWRRRSNMSPLRYAASTSLLIT